jgi:hypothetical protein
LSVAFAAPPVLAADRFAHLPDSFNLAMQAEAPASPPDTPAPAAHSEASAEDLAKKTQNPVADMISVPLQSNFNFKTGQNDDLQYILNVQPVIPIKISEEWNMITRTIVPLICQPSLGPGIDSAAGLGDIQLQLFFSPSKPSKFVWGVGPIFQFDTATDDVLGQGKWCAGPTAVALVMDGPWVVGALANNIWSFAGDDDREDVNQMLVQPFVNYNFKGGWYLTFAPIITANWEADSDDRWTVPLGGGAGKVLHFGKLPVNTSLQAYYNVEHPDDGPEWQLRFQVQFLFPR